MNSFSPKECDAKPEALEDQADELEGLAERITGKSGDLNSQFNDSAKEFSEMVSEGIRGVAERNREAWGDAVFACIYASKIARRWASDVRSYESKIEKLQDEWDEERKDNFGVDMENTQGAGGIGADKALLNARENTAESLNSQAHDHWTKLVERANEHTDALKEGPTQENVQNLIDDGALKWAPFNLKGAEQPIPIDKKQGGKDAEKINEYIEKKDKDLEEIDNFPPGLAQNLNILKERIAYKQQNGGELTKAEIGYMDKLVFGVDEGSYDRSILDVANSGDRKFKEGIASAVLALSDEELGGSYDDIPQSIKRVAEGPDEPRSPSTTERHEYDDWVADAKKIRKSV
ncbi:hypothetical protein FHX37_2790 [Haloactinospora alba]|uniref:Uncharacterized protein n=1 Tax=Haloactinospora alba TaxID=405555 RepID=A0A543NLX7_9ACTN|nr:hypothetical protein [Haloactinospora alba]TQN32807.1 hypothetical protein FHX37_2790 [Haloactinospora alba]